MMNVQVRGLWSPTVSDFGPHRLGKRAFRPPPQTGSSVGHLINDP